MRTGGAAPVTIKSLSDPVDTMAVDVIQGLSAQPKWLSPKYFYDDRGSELFEAITESPEYYPTRTELGILTKHAPSLMRSVQPAELIELGSGASLKARTLIDAMHGVGGSRYVPIDISEGAVRAAALDLCEDYPWLRIDGFVGDFFEDLHKIDRHGTRLVSFLGSTIGNFQPTDRAEFLEEVATMLEPDDRFLLGVDLVKPVEILVPAYADAQGVTASFNLNVLNVINRELSANFDLDLFEHVATWNEESSCIDMFVEAQRAMRVELKALDMTVEIAAHERIHTEQSCKFTRETVEQFLSAAGLATDRWLTDDQEWFALAVVRTTETHR